MKVYSNLIIRSLTMQIKNSENNYFKMLESKGNLSLRLLIIWLAQLIQIQKKLVEKNKQNKLRNRQKKQEKVENNKLD